MILCRWPGDARAGACSKSHRRQRRVAAKQITCAFGNGDDGGVDGSGGDRWNDRSVTDIEAFDSLQTQIGRDDSVRRAAHAASAHRMMVGESGFLQELQPL